MLPASQPVEKILVIERESPRGGAGKAPVLKVLGQELARSMRELKEQADPPPYFLSYQATDTTKLDWVIYNGALAASNDTRVRQLDVDVRVGSPQLDNTHTLEEKPHQSRLVSVQLPLEDEEWALRMAIWRGTDESYKVAAKQLSKVKASRTVKVADEDQSPDFSEEPAQSYLEEPATFQFDRPRWEQRLRAYSALFAGHAHIEQWAIKLEVIATTRYFTSSEGTEVQTGRNHLSLLVAASTTALDGMKLSRTEVIDADSPETMPNDGQVERRLQGAIGDLGALKDAPIADPYEGPAILEGETAGFFFHEIFGHRVEGNRQRDDAEGQTFAKKLGKPVMPDFVDIYDDPSVTRVNGILLNGHYLYDDQGVPGQRASLVERGTLKGFLLSRTPVRGLVRSNGHGRREPGAAMVPRQGNLFVDPAKVVAREELTRRLLEQVREQHKAYGLRFVKAEGGLTSTLQSSPQSFKVRPAMVYRVYPDGREELIRGVDLEGTPLTALSEIIAAGNDYTVANGVCGAESGQLPVAAVSPSLLIRRVEVARQKKGRDRPPLLSAPQAAKGAP